MNTSRNTDGFRASTGPSPEACRARTRAPGSAETAGPSRAIGLVWLGLVLTLLLAGCSDRQVTPTAQADGRTVIAWVGERPIGEAAVAEAWSQRPQARREVVLESLIRRELILAEIRRTGFDERPDVRESWEAHLVQRFSEEQRRRMESSPEPSPEVLASYHARHAERYQSPARARMAILQVRPIGNVALAQPSPSEASLARIRERALNLAADVAGFGPLALEVSEHRATRSQGGDLGWMTAPQLRTCLPAEVADAAEVLAAAGEVSPWIRTSQGSFLVKLMQREPAALQPLSAVIERVRFECSQANRDAAEAAYFAALRTSFGVRINAPTLAKLSPPAPTVAVTAPRLPTR